MMSSLFSAVSGMKNHQTRMDVLGNNISNVNTIGFKAGRVTFQDQLSQTLQGASSASGNRGGTNPSQKGLGMSLASIDTIFTNGNYQSTGKTTDVAIQGTGFFVISDGKQQYYTRAGAFDYDTQGNYLLPGSGFKVMGWMADNAGIIDVSNPIQGIQVPVGKTMDAKVSTTVTHTKNLSADSAVGSSYSAAIEVFDSLGIAHNSQTTYTKIGENRWLSVTNMAGATPGSVTGNVKEVMFTSTGQMLSTKDFTLPATTDTANFTKFDLSNDNATSPIGTVVKGVVTVMVDGKPRIVTATATRQTPTGSPAPENQWSIQYSEGGKNLGGGVVHSGGVGGVNPLPVTTLPGMTIGGKAVTIAGTTNVSFLAAGLSDITGTLGTVGTTNLPLAFTPIGGAAAMSLTYNIDGITQYGGDTSIQATGRDGYAAGSLGGVQIDTTGTLVGRFTNGETMILGRIATATFNNPGGLEKVGSSLYARSNNSGEPQINAPGVGGSGSINPGTLEMSNVDLSEEFSNMIITQRGYQSNARVITTSDELLQELTNLKR